MDIHEVGPQCGGYASSPPGDDDDQSWEQGEGDGGRSISKGDGDDDGDADSDDDLLDGLPRSTTSEVPPGSVCQDAEC